MHPLAIPPESVARAGTAANSDAEHGAPLAAIWTIPGDVMTTDFAIERLRLGAAGRRAA